MGAAERWLGRALTAEAMAYLLLARALVAWVPLAKWRSSLGAPSATSAADAFSLGEGNRVPRRLARAVLRATARLPGQSLCLPQAIALQWLLHRRGLGGVLVIGVRPGTARGGIDDLHAWIVRQGETLIGQSDQPHHPIYTATFEAERT